MDVGGLRLRATVDEYFWEIVVVLVVLGAVGGFLTYNAYGQTTERTETTVTNEVVWTSTGQFTHQATVTNDTRVFDSGETLTNRSTYFRKITPRLDGAFVYNYTADSGEVNAETSMVLRIRSVDTGDGSQREYWRIERPLAETTTTLAPNESLRASFSQNVSKIPQAIERIQTQLGTTAGTTETAIVATIDLDGTRNGQQVATNRTYSLPLTVGNDVYEVNDSGPVVEQGERSVREAVTEIATPGPLWRYGGPLALLVGLVGLSGVAYGRYDGRIPVSDREIDYLGYRTDRTEFDEWITEARFPVDRIEQTDTRIETTSLSGLVDLAIDSDRRVIEHPDHDAYLVLDGNVVYTYDPPKTETDADDPLAPADGATGADGLIESDATDSSADGRDGDTTAQESDGTAAPDSPAPEEDGSTEPDEEMDGPADEPGASTDSLVERLRNTVTTDETGAADEPDRDSRDRSDSPADQSDPSDPE